MHDLITMMNADVSCGMHATGEPRTETLPSIGQQQFFGDGQSRPCRITSTEFLFVPMDHIEKVDRWWGHPKFLTNHVA